MNSQKARPTKPSVLPRGDTWVQQLENQLDNDGMALAATASLNWRPNMNFCCAALKFWISTCRKRRTTFFRPRVTFPSRHSQQIPQSPLGKLLQPRVTSYRRSGMEVSKLLPTSPGMFRTRKVAPRDHPLWERTAAMHCEASQLRDTNPMEHGLHSCIIKWII